MLVDASLTSWDDCAAHKPAYNTRPLVPRIGGQFLIN
jgi:hypothetical protein